MNSILHLFDKKIFIQYLLSLTTDMRAGMNWWVTSWPDSALLIQGNRLYAKLTDLNDFDWHIGQLLTQYSRKSINNWYLFAAPWEWLYFDCASALQRYINKFEMNTTSTYRCTHARTRQLNRSIWSRFELSNKYTCWG